MKNTPLQSRSTETPTGCLGNKYLIERDPTTISTGCLKSQVSTLISILDPHSKMDWPPLWPRPLRLLPEAHQVVECLDLIRTLMSPPNLFMNSNATWFTSSSSGLKIIPLDYHPHQMSLPSTKQMLYIEHIIHLNMAWHGIFNRHASRFIFLVISNVLIFLTACLLYSPIGNLAYTKTLRWARLDKK